MPPARARGRVPRLLAGAVLVSIVTLVAATVAPDLLSPSDGFVDPASATDILTGLDSPVNVPTSGLLPLFESGPAQAQPQPVNVPPLRSNPVLAALGVPLPGHVDLQSEGAVPADFQAFVEGAVGAGIAAFDSYYRDQSFNFTTATAANHFGLLVTTNRAPFDALTHVASFRSGFMDPCPNRTADPNACVPRVMIFFDPAKWIKGEYDPMSAPRIEHEVFHVAHFYLLRGMGKAALFSVSGYYWQTEGFATFTQRNLPDLNAYLSFNTQLLSLGYFSWPRVTDASYEDSYAAAPFLDEMVYRAGGNPATLLKWLKAAEAETPSSLSLMSTFAPGPANTVDIARFQKLWLASMLDLNFPGLLPATDGRTASIGRALPPPSATVTKDTLPVSASKTLPPIGSGVVNIAVQSLPDEKDVKNLRISLASDLAANERAVLLVLRGGPGADLASCYQGLGIEAKMAAGARACFRAHARVLGVVTRGGGTGVKVAVAALKRFSPDLSHLSVVAFVAHTISDLGAGGLQPLHATLTVAKDVPEEDRASLVLDVTGDVNGHLTAAQFTDNSESTCHLQQGGWMNLLWQPSLNGQAYLFNLQIHGFHGPGVYQSGYDNRPPSSSFGLTRLDKAQTAWVDDFVGTITINADGQSGTFQAPLGWRTDGKVIRQVTVSGSFACAIVIR